MTESAENSKTFLWTQAVAQGAAMLIPARKYPAVVRHVLTWGTTVGIFTLLAVPGAADRLREAARRRAGTAHLASAEANAPASPISAPEALDTQGGNVMPPETGQDRVVRAEVEKSALDSLDANPVARIGLATAVAAGNYGVFRFSFWMDHAAERGLQKLGVPYPRAVMGLAVGGLVLITERLDRGHTASTEQSAVAEKS